MEKQMPTTAEHGSADNRVEEEVPRASRDSDFRGPYGFGRPAHRPDPNASYGFRPEPNRVLPPRGQQAREARLRRMAAGQGLFLSKSRRRRPDSGAAGGYMLFDNPDRAVAVLGGSGERGPWDVSGPGYQASLDEIEAYLARGQDRGHRED
ncbi:MAG TPA: hypothetical protein VN240_03630 [Propylenella sp.]|nr:hypothetical protein [Propylenella sp.]